MSKPNHILSRRVEKILPDKSGLIKLMSQKKIRLYQGFDPTGNRLHLGHTIGLRLLMEFARAGHEVIFLFGTGTVLVGDPSQRDSGRKLIAKSEIEKNFKNWKSQVSPLVDFNLVTIKKNADWLGSLKLADIISIASHISATQLFKREMFQRRIERGDVVWYHETMYPLLQGYDSVVMDVDLEIGGTDQEFNMLIGRELQKKINHKEKYVLTTPMILGTDGRQMSKTSGNCIWLDDSPQDMYGKIMRIPDEMLQEYFKLLTDIPLAEIPSLLTNPNQAKQELARDIVKQFHGKEKADYEKNEWKNRVQKGKVPSNIKSTLIPVYPQKLKISTKPYLLKTRPKMTIFALCKLNFEKHSGSEIKRIIKQGGVELNQKKITDPNQEVKIQNGDIIKFGKRSFKKLILTNS